MKRDDGMTGSQAKVFGRIMSYLRPYRKAVVLAFAALAVATAAELAAPVILQRAVDGTILREYRRIYPVGAEDETIGKILATDAGTTLGAWTYVGREALAAVTGEAVGAAEEAGFLDSEGWYVFRMTKERADLVNERAELFESDGNHGAVRIRDLQDFSREEKVILKEDDAEDLKKITLLFLAVLTAGLLASFFQVYLMAYTGQSVMIDLRMGLFSHLLHQALSHLNRKPVGSLVTRASNDVETVNDLFAQVATSLLRDLTVMLGVLAALFLLNRRLAVITALSLPPVLLLTLVFRVKARDAYRRVRAKVSGINTFLSEHIAGMEVVQMFAREAASYRDFEKGNRELLEANLGEMYVFATFRPIVDLLASVSIGVVLYWGASSFSKTSISLGILIAFINLVEKFYQPLKDISEQFTIMQSAMAGGERVFQTLDEDIRILPGPEELAPEAVRGDIELNHVFFSYNPDEPVLKDLSLHVGPGETAALVGYTGAGKTTVANLLTRLWDLDSGTITLDGRDIKNYSLSSLRRAIQPVDQDVFLFQGTFAENISLGKDMRTEVLEQAARAVFLHDYIQSLPEKYDTELAEGGANLSAGQRQLLSFARVIAHDPRVLILDEATASIDTQTEQLVQKALKRVLSGRTSLVIAHRLSTIRDADRIFVLSGGILVEQGSHEELIAKKGAYYNLYRLQYKSE